MPPSLLHMPSAHCFPSFPGASDHRTRHIVDPWFQHAELFLQSLFPTSPSPNLQSFRSHECPSITPHDLEPLIPAPACPPCFLSTAGTSCTAPWSFLLVLLVQEVRWSAATFLTAVSLSSCPLSFLPITYSLCRFRIKMRTLPGLSATRSVRVVLAVVPAIRGVLHSGFTARHVTPKMETRVDGRGRRRTAWKKKKT